jgi:hypothetical protein
MSQVPLISCLCVTRGKADLLSRAVKCFQAQSYANKELLLVYENDDTATGAYVNELIDPRVSRVEVPSYLKMSLGQLRNLAVEKCGGEYFCQWDDDDWYHCRRLEFQMDVIQESQMKASIMIYWLVYNMVKKEAYVSGRRLWEGSILCNKSLTSKEVKYDDSKKGEDTNLIKNLFARGRVFPIIMPKLYIYVYHGKNVWEYAHWQKIFAASRKLSETASKLIYEILIGKFTVEEGSNLLDQLSE